MDINLPQGAHLQEPQALESERRKEPRKGLATALSDALSRWDLVGALVPYLKDESHSVQAGTYPRLTTREQECTKFNSMAWTLHNPCDVYGLRSAWR